METQKTAETTTAATEVKYVVTDADSEIIHALEERQAAAQMSDEKFAKEHLTISGSYWNRVKSGDVWKLITNGRKLVNELSRCLDRFDRQAALRAKFEKMRFVGYTESDAVFSALDECLSLPLSNPERMVVYLAPTRGGKTWLCGQAIKQFKAVVIQAREAWLTSYWQCLKDFCLATGAISPGAYVNKGGMETALVQTLNSRRWVLAIDEGEFFDRESLNLVKYLLNSTTVVILLCAIPGAYDRWQQRYPHESSQILARCHSVIPLDPITPKVAHEFIKHAKLEDRSECDRLAAAFANAFGLFSMLVYIGSQFTADQPITPTDIRAAGNARRRTWRLPELSFEKQPK